MKKLSFAFLFSFVGLGFTQLTAVSAFAETAETQAVPAQMVTLTVHELDQGNQEITSGAKEGTPLVGVPVSIYDLMAAYQSIVQQGIVDTKKFSEEWSEKALKGTADLGTPLATKITDDLGVCTFSVPLKINEQYAAYLIVEETSSTVEQTGKTVPTVVIFPVVSLETGELLNPVEVYPKYVDGLTPEKPEEPQPEKPQPEKPQPEKPATTKTSPSGENYPSTNEATSSLSTFGLLLIVGIGSTWYFNRRKETQKNN